MAGSKEKRQFRDIMLESAQYLSCTSAIAGEAFSIRNVNVLCILSPQKPKKGGKRKRRRKTKKKRKSRKKKKKRKTKKKRRRRRKK